MYFRFALYGFLKNLRFFEPFIVLIFRDAGLSFFQIGVLYSIAAITSNVLEIPTGVYADTVGRRRSLVLAFVAYLLSFAIFYLFAGFLPYSIAMALFGFGDAFRSGTHKALILEYLRLTNREDGKVAYYGRTRAASQLGSAVNSLLAAGIVLFTGQYRYLFLASSLPYVLGLINIITYPASLEGHLADRGDRSLSDEFRATIRRFVATLHDRQAMRAVLNSASFTAGFKISKDYLQPIVRMLAISMPVLVLLGDTERTAILMGVVYFAVYLLASYASRSAERVGSHFKALDSAINATFVAGGLVIIGAGIATWLGVSVAAVIFFVALHALQNLRKPMNVAFISDQIDRKVMASGLSAESQISTLVQMALAPALGALADSIGIGPAFGVFGVLWIAAVPLLRVRGRVGPDQIRA